MNDKSITLKIISKIALAALALQLVASIVFYKERVLFADGAYLLFQIIHNHGLFILSHRYGEVITQFPAYLFQKMNLPLKAVMMSFAIAPNIFYVLVAALLVYVFKYYKFAILMTLYYFLFIGASFIPFSDVSVAIALMFLLFGTIAFMGYKKVNMWLILIPFSLLSLITVSTHFIIIIPVVFLLVYLGIEKEQWPFSVKQTIGLGCTLAFVICCKFFIIASGPQTYDGNRLYGVTHFSLHDIIYSFTTPVIGKFAVRCLTIYWVATLVFVTGMVSLIMGRKYKLASWCFLSCLGYFIIMGLTYGEEKWDILLWHIETEWASLSIIIATPFVFSLLPRLNLSIAISAFVFMLLVRAGYIAATIPDYTWRLNFQQTVLAAMKKKGITKLVLYRDSKSIITQCILDWAFPVETLIHSSINGDSPQSTFFYINTDHFDLRNVVTSSNDFYVAYNMVPASSLNSQYFYVDSTLPYKVMTYDELVK